MKILIIGRTSTGKDTLKDILEQTYGWKFVKSMTTRPKRHENEDTHVFINEETAAEFTPDQIAAETVINGYKYFATKEQVKACDGYIIDPIGMYDLTKRVPDETFRIVYLKAEDEALRDRMAIRRSNNPTKEAEVYAKRKAAENAQFTEFEKKLQEGDLPKNCTCSITFVNQFDIEELTMFAQKLDRTKIAVKATERIIRQLIKDGVFTGDDNTVEVDIVNKDNTTTHTSIPISEAADGAEADPKQFHDIFTMWLYITALKGHDKSDDTAE